MLYLRLNSEQRSRLAVETVRFALIDDCEALGFRYIALDLEPLRV